MVKVHNQPDVTYSCKLLYESIQLPIFYTEDGHDVETIWGNEDHQRPFYMEFDKLFRPFIEKEMKHPVILDANSWEELIIVPIKRSGERHGFVVIGPSIQQVPTDEHIHGLLHDNQMSYRDLPHWKAHWDSLPVVSRLRLLHISVLAHWMINQEALEITDVLQYSYQYVLPAKFQSNIEIEIQTKRELSVSNHSSNIEKRLIELIRTGNTSELMKEWITYPNEGVGILSKRSQLRNIKNLAICSIAIAMRAAVDGGIYEELAFTLSDLHIQQIEELNDVKAVEAALVRALMDFTERVEQSRKESMSRPIRICCEYIFNHLFQKITFDKLAELTGLNSNYLMNLFKEQTGMTLMNYIQKQRIEEAKKLLHMTNDTISSIGLRLNFYDQSHFIKVFKKYMSMTPKKYRSTIKPEGQ
ncbi:AraC family transcriptional regulator [Paenibacillus sp.]|uniref:AraC family transcriptional regulator n=1 Tax=Paenibacillus sp. TaxID=58172 RepID=UPI0028A67BBD|nr:AraC family transcriptional regulator [Paenibacillus sp.]